LNSSHLLTLLSNSGEPFLLDCWLEFCCVSAICELHRTFFLFSIHFSAYSNCVREYRYFGLQSGWVTMGSLQSTLLGFGFFR
jgi:hypothetical protein